jgi:catechol 2,3-dioxygenase-like lactoylglutathione lyase family enzyme
MKTPITHVRYVGLGVEAFDEERRFLEEVWSLTETSGTEDIAYFSARGSSEPYILRLHRTADRRTELLSFAADDREGVDSLYASLKAKAAKLVTEPVELTGPGGGYGFRLFDLDGRLLEISTNYEKREAEVLAPKSAIPQGLSHAVFHAPDIKATVAWYEEFLGLRVSDWLDEFMCFLRGKGSKHHCLAFLVGPATLNHIAFELASMDEMMRGIGRLMKHGRGPYWGPGRHTAGDNTFAYFTSPAGNTYEYTAEVEYLPDGWQPRTLPRAADVLDQWGTGRLAGPAYFPPVVEDPSLWSADVV